VVVVVVEGLARELQKVLEEYIGQSGWIIQC
jgi:hypothetical protein